MNDDKNSGDDKIVGSSDGLERCGTCKHYYRCQDLLKRTWNDVPCNWVPTRYVYDAEKFGTGKASDAF